jgi:hypothetical protein
MRMKTKTGDKVKGWVKPLDKIARLASGGMI